MISVDLNFKICGSPDIKALKLWKNRFCLTYCMTSGPRHRPDNPPPWCKLRPRTGCRGCHPCWRCTTGSRRSPGRRSCTRPSRPRTERRGCRCHSGRGGGIPAGGTAGRLICNLSRWAEDLETGKVANWVHVTRIVRCPTDPFTTLELQNPSHHIPELNKIRQSLDFEALKLWKGLSGKIPAFWEVRRNLLFLL